MPIARVLTLVLGGLVLLAALPVLVLGYIGAEDNTSRLLRDRSEETLNNLVYRITTHLEPARQQLRYVQNAVAQGVVDIGSLEEGGLGTFFLGALAATPQITGIGHVLPDRSMRRYDRGDLRMYYEDPSRVPYVDQSLAKARKYSDTKWFAPVWSPILQEPILRLVAPLRDPSGTFQGAMVAAVTTSALSRYLKIQKSEGGPKAFILAGRDRVLAHPHLADQEATMPKHTGDPLPRIDKIGDPVLAAMWSEEQNPLTALAPFREAEGHWTWIGDKSFAYVYRTLNGYGDQPWTVGLYYPGVETRRERWIVHGIAIGGVVLLALALSAAMLIGRRLGRPILGLAAVAERIESLDLDGVRDVPRGPIREVNRAAGAFERMAAGLRLFETYVPRALVRSLIAAGAERPKSESRELTIMFTDLEGYSSFSAGRPADEIADYLNSLLARIGPLIEGSGGTIDNFMGDGVMAFWGAPEPRDDHADAACHAALQMVEAVSRLSAERRRAGLPVCRLRIGIHTGTVVVGNIGFEGRVHYTIVGEAVNIAQRLERLGRDQDNGHPDVTILVSRQTQNATTQPFEFETAFEELDGRMQPAAPLSWLKADCD